MIVLTVATLATVVQLLVLYGCGKRVPIGDEIEYLNRATSDDPYAADPFLRVPLMTVLLRCVRGRRTEPRARVLMAIVAVLTVICTTWSAVILFDGAAALTCGILLALWPDRLLLSQHLWPDCVLALWLSLLLVLLAGSATGCTVSLWLFGITCALACLTRIDALLWPLALMFTAEIRSLGPLPSALVPMWAPSLMALGLLTWRNYRRCGVPWPDTTFMFNILVAAREGDRPNNAVENLVGEQFRSWEQREYAQRWQMFRAGLTLIVRNPLPHLASAARRAHDMLGPDTFGRQRLLAQPEGAYPELKPRLRALLAGALNYSFGILVVLASATLAELPLVPGYMIMLGCTFLTSCLVHARTRFRYVLLPPLSLAATHGLTIVATQRLNAVAIGLMLVAAYVVRRSRGRAETLLAPEVDR